MTDHVSEFWRWFAKSEAEVREAYESGDTRWLDVNLSPRVQSILEDARWELGPYAHPENALVLSPRTRQGIAPIKEAVARAPLLAGWRFFACKPPKALRSLEFRFRGATTIADSWACRITSYNDGEFVDLEIFYEATAAPPEGSELALCELVVEALVGEEVRLDRIGIVTPAKAEDVRSVSDSIPITELRQWLSRVLRPIH